MSEKRVRKVRVPQLGLHKGSGQARVVIDGRDLYLGKPGLEAERRYRNVIAHWLETGEVIDSGETGQTVADLVAAFLVAHENYYVGPDGKQTGELLNYKEAFRVLLEGNVATLVDGFSPKRLKGVRSAMVGRGWCRNVVNNQVRRLKRVFKWGTSEELVPPEVFHGLQAVEGLRRFRSEARESHPVEAVPLEDLEATLLAMSGPVATMVRLQLLTGMRVSEVLAMRGREINRSGEVWIYRPAQHKTMHYGRDRVVALGPQAQAELRPWLVLDSSARLFSPIKAERARNERRRAGRKTRVQPSQRRRTERAANRRRKRAPGESYTVDGYRRAVHRACDRAGVPRWSPSRLRHNAAEKLRSEFGVETARCALGHADVRTTELYSSLDQAKATEAMGRIG